MIFKLTVEVCPSPSTDRGDDVQRNVACLHRLRQLAPPAGGIIGTFCCAKRISNLNVTFERSKVTKDRRGRGSPTASRIFLSRDVSRLAVRVLVEKISSPCGDIPSGPHPCALRQRESLAKCAWESLPRFLRRGFLRAPLAQRVLYHPHDWGKTATAPKAKK